MSWNPETQDRDYLECYRDYMNVGVRALKSKLSEYLGRAAAGEDIIVTDRGRPIVRLVPFAGESALERGIAEGWIDPPSRSALKPVDRVRAELSSLEVLGEDRG